MWLLIFLTLFSCDKNKQDDSEQTENNDKKEVVHFDYSMNNLNKVDFYQNNNVKGGEKESTLLEEASGLAVSHSNSNILWSHNDKGHANHVFLVGDKGEDYGYYTLQGAGNRDWEDTCIGPGEEENTSYVYIGEIGDNNGVYSSVFIYSFKEPDLTNEEKQEVRTISNDEVSKVEYTYPDGPRDAETLMIDPWTRDLYIVSKRTKKSILYRAKFPHTSGKLEKLAVFPFNWAVGGDISSDGKKIAIKDKYNIYYWEREEGQSIVDALSVKPQKLPYIKEPQGEAFAWSLDGKSYFTLSEDSPGIKTELYFYTQ